MTVVAYQWCDREKQAGWEALLARLPAPDTIVCDGQKGLLAAIKRTWPDTRIQRCLVHIHRDIVGHLTHHPRTAAGQTLLKLAHDLMMITSIEQASVWMNRMNDWWNLFGKLTTKRTWRSLTPEAQVPAWVKPHQRWWYTHARLRSAYRLIATQIQAGTLFVYLQHDHADSTSNKIEGGINAQIRHILSHHRGLSQAHARRAAEWFCYLHSHEPQPHHLIETPQKPASTNPGEEPALPPLWGTGLTPEEGLWTRKGWAGRST